MFEVSSELLASTDTRVRCGECYAIFDAASNLVDKGATQSAEGESAYVDEGDGSRDDTSPLGATSNNASADSSADGSALDVTYSDFDLFSEEADLPEIAYFDQTRDTPEFDFDSVALEEDETFNDTLFAHDVTIDAGSALVGRRIVVPAAEAAAAAASEAVGADLPDEPLVFNYRDPEPEAKSDSASGAVSGEQKSAESSSSADETAPGTAIASGAEGDDTGNESALEDAAAPIAIAELAADDKQSGSFWLMAVLLLCLATLVSALYAWRHRDRLHNDPLTRPVYEVFCQVTDCVVPSRVSIADLKLVDRNVYSHPDIEDALVIDVSFRNEAAFSQRYPMLVIRLSDPSGRMVARRAFEPQEYIATWQSDDTIEPGGRRDISLDVSDPGENASSFEVDFLPTKWSDP